MRKQNTQIEPDASPIRKVIVVTAVFFSAIGLFTFLRATTIGPRITRGHKIAKIQGDCALWRQFDKSHIEDVRGMTHKQYGAIYVINFDNPNGDYSAEKLRTYAEQNNWAYAGTADFEADNWRAYLDYQNYGDEPQNKQMALKFEVYEFLNDFCQTLALPLPLNNQAFSAQAYHVGGIDNKLAVTLNSDNNQQLYILFSSFRFDRKQSLLTLPDSFYQLSEMQGHSVQTTGRPSSDPNKG